MPPPKDPIKYALYIERQSKSRKGKKRPCKTQEEYNERTKKMSQLSRKLWDTPELRDKLISSMKKKKLSEDHKKKIGVGISGDRNPMKNPKNVETLKRSIKGKPKSKEHRENISRSRMGQKPSEETREKYRIRKRQLAKDPDYLERNRYSTILAKNEIWYGGVRYFEDERYCELWIERLRERCRAYFNYTCVECGTPQNGRKHGVHHIHYNKKTCCDGSPRDLFPLCTECHGKTTSGNRKYWEQHFTEMLYSYYSGKCFFTEEEMVAWENV